MANEITPLGTARPLRTPAVKSVTDKAKTQAETKKKPRDKEEDQPDDDAQVHIDEYI